MKGTISCNAASSAKIAGTAAATAAAPGASSGLLEGSSCCCPASSSMPADRDTAAAAEASSSSGVVVSIHPLLLSISPRHLEQQFWAQPHITAQLLNIDRFAFVVSTLNIYSGWNTARMVHSAPSVSAVMAGLCVLFLLLSVVQQLAMKRCPGWYLQHREDILLATRIVRGGWMVVMCCITQEVDIVGSFTGRRLGSGVSPQLVVLQLLMLFTLIFLGQCLYWPLHFKRALPLQAAYVITSLAAMRSAKCVLGRPGLAAGACGLCFKAQTTVSCLTTLLTEGQLSCLAPDDADAASKGTAAERYIAANNSSVCSSSSSSSSIGGSGGSGSSSWGSDNLCGLRSNEKVLVFWLVTFGLLLPLYIMYVRELSFKQRFLRGQQQPDRQVAVAVRNSNALAGGVLQMGLLLHGVALSSLLKLGSVFAELLLLALPPPVCA